MSIKSTIFRLLCIAFIAINFTACSTKDDPKPKLTANTIEITLFYDQTFELELKRGSVVVPFNEVTSSSSDEFVGRVTSSGVFEAAHVGETEITLAHDGEFVKIIASVQPRQTFFTEPVLEFGKDKNFIKQTEKRELSFEGTDGLFFNGENTNVLRVFYTFDFDRMFGAMISFPFTSINIDRVVEYYSERYHYEGQLDDYFVHSNKNRTVLVALTVSSGELAAIYTQNTTQKNALTLESKIKDFDEVRGIVK